MEIIPVAITGNDTLFGAAENDRIWGLQDDDKLYGEAGNDYLVGGAGINFIYGGGGLDWISYEDFGPFSDITSGVLVSLAETEISRANPYDSNDTELYGLATAGDAIDYFTGIENVYGSRFADTIQGSSGTNWIIGGGGIGDILDGAGGNDVLKTFGSSSAALNGGIGNDYIEGDGSATLVGGLGNDFYYVHDINITLDSEIWHSRGDGIDKINYADSNATLRFKNLQPHQIAIGFDYASPFNSKAININESSYVENWTLEDITDIASDPITIAASLPTGEWVEIAGQWTAGVNRTISTIRAGVGNEIAYDLSVLYPSWTPQTQLPQAHLGSSGDDTLNGGENVEVGDLLLGGVLGNDSLKGNAGNDTLAGGKGNDTLDGGSGADIMWGGSGDDVYVVDSLADEVHEEATVRESNADATQYVDSLGGIDTVKASVTTTLSANVENLTLTGTNAIDGTGNALGNTIAGNSAANTIIGNDGNDSITGGDGNDTLRGNNDDDMLDGGNGNDFLYGGYGNDQLTGGNHNDFLQGLDGNDTLWGSNGVDTMEGGKGDDWFRVDSASDVVTEQAAEGTDTVESYITYSLGANVENLTLLGGTAINATGNAGNNNISGNGSANTLLGGDGNDMIAGNGGADLLKGDGGDDNLSGGDGNDTLFGGGLGDTLTGGAGADSFAFRSGFGNDTITDLSVNSDQLDLRYLGLASVAALDIYDSGSDVMIVVAAGTQTIRVQGHTEAELLAAPSSLWLFA